MEWAETALSKECKRCQKQDCYNCDSAGERWELSRTDELQLRRKGLLKAIERLEREVKEIDAELSASEE